MASVQTVHVAGRNDQPRKRIAIIGAGPVGLSLAYFLRDQDVTILEKEDRVGGLTSPFEFNGRFYDRYYHFVFLNDYHTIRLARELGIGNRIRWGSPRMAVYWHGKTYPFTTPKDLLLFPGLSASGKARFVLGTLRISRMKRWHHLERLNGVEWFRRLYGDEVTDTIWLPMMKKKFGAKYANVNAAWCWNEIYRRGKSRKSLQKERLGYYDGGVKTLLDAISRKLASAAVRIRTKVTITRIQEGQGRERRVSVSWTHAGEERTEEFDHVFATIPSIVLNRYLDPEKRIALPTVDYLNIRCAVFVTKRRLTPHFWINICDDTLPQVLMNEFANLSGAETNCVYLPYYLPSQSDIYSMDDEKFRQMNLSFIREFCPDFSEKDILCYRSFKDPFAQAVFDQEYSKKLLPYTTPVKNLFIANHSQIYPERSGINECIRFAELLVKDLKNGTWEQHFFTSE